MRHLVRKAELLYRRRAVAAADDGRSVLRIRHRLRDRDRALGERRVFEHAHRPVPDDRLCALDRIREQFARFFANVEPLHIRGDLAYLHRLHFDRRVYGVGEIFRDDRIDGQEQFFAHILRLLDHILAVAELFVVYEGFADLIPLRFEEGVRHAAADDEGIALVQEVGYYVELIRDLCAAEHRNERAHGVVEAVSHHFEFLLDKEAADGRLYESLLDDRRRGGVRAVRRAERVVHIDIAIGSELFAEFGISPLFAGIETQVFEQYAFALFERRDFLFCVGTNDVGSESNFIVQKLVEPVRDRFQREFFEIALRLFDILGGSLSLIFRGQSLDRLFLLFIEFDLFVEDIVRLAHVRAQNDFRVVLHQVFDGGQRAHDAVFVGDLSVLHRNVEVHADEHSLAAYIYIGDRLFIHDSYLLVFSLSYIMIPFFTSFVNLLADFSYNFASERGTAVRRCPLSVPSP